MPDASRIYQNDRVMTDLKNRSLIGIPAYAVLWCVIIFPTGHYADEPAFSMIFLALFIAVGLFRLAHVRRFSRLIKERKFLNYVLLNLGILIPAALWGIAFTKLMLAPVGDSITAVVMILTSAGFCSGGTGAYCPDRRLAALYAAAMLLPTAAASLALKQSERIIPVLMIIYFAYLYFLIRTGSREYWSALENEERLKENSRKMEKLSEIDALTGLFNRGYFNKTFDREWRLATREGRRMTLILIDLDHFKRINDTHGHLAGDEYLRRTSALFMSFFKRASDVVARYGGEEFAVLLPGADEETAFRLCDDLRREMEHFYVDWQGVILQTTVSLGVASHLPRHTESEKILIAKADEALYQAKERGRNRVCVQRGPTADSDALTCATSEAGKERRAQHGRQVR